MVRLFQLALLLVIASTAPAAARDRDQIEGLIHRVTDAEEAKDMGGILGATWPDGYYSISNPDQRDSSRRIGWRGFTFGGTGVFYRTTTSRPRISFNGDRATATFIEHTRRFHDDEYSGMSAISRSRAEFERRHGEWRVLNWYRALRWRGSGRYSKESL